MRQRGVERAQVLRPSSAQLPSQSRHTEASRSSSSFCSLEPSKAEWFLSSAATLFVIEIIPRTSRDIPAEYYLKR